MNRFIKLTDTYINVDLISAIHEKRTLHNCYTNVYLCGGGADFVTVILPMQKVIEALRSFDVEIYEPFIKTEEKINEQ